MVNKIFLKSNIIYIFLLIIYWFIIDIFNQNLLTPETLYISKSAFIFNIVWIIIFNILLYISNSKFRKYITLFFNLILLIFSIINYFMYSYFNCVFSWKDLILTGEGLSFVDSVFKFINFKIILFVLICIILNIFIFKFSKFDTYRIKSKQTILLIILFSISIGLYSYNTTQLSKTTDGWDAKEILNNDSNFYTNWVDSNKLLNISGTYQYLIKDLYMSFFYKQKIKNSNKIITSYINENMKTTNDLEYFGRFKDKNLIFVMMESIEDWQINEQVTPTLFYMMQHGFNFTNHYSPDYVVGKTANTEFIANTGIYPNINHMTPHYAYTDNSFPFSIANLFKEEGYLVNSFHRSLEHIYNRKAMHEAFGYSRYHSFSDMGIDFKNVDYDSNLIIDGYDKIVNDDKFMSFIITYTGHSPYSYSENKCKKNLEEIEKLNITNNLNEEEKCALSAARETDKMFKKLLNKLKDDDKLDDTIIVAFSDHPNYVKLNDNETNLLNKTIFFIYNNKSSSHQINTLTSSINILPTVINLFGINTKYVYAGYDALNTKNEYVIFKDYTYFNGKEILPINEILEKNINYSKALLVSDYYKNKN